MVATVVNGTYNSYLSDFIPDIRLRRTDADTLLVFLIGNGVLFSEKTEDDWYHATTPFGVLESSISTGSSNAYQSDEAASPMGCTRQYQYCKLRESGVRECGPLASWADAFAGAAPIFGVSADKLDEDRPVSTSEEGSRLIWSYMTILTGQGASLEFIIRQLGADSLASRSSLSESIMGPLPTNQWQLDVLQWWNIMLAVTQASFVDAAHRPNSTVTDRHRVLPVNTYEENFCKSMVRSISRRRLVINTNRGI